MAAKLPYVFIGSSSEGLDVAKAIQANLQYVCESHIWSQGLFGLSSGTLETLVNKLDSFDFAILALTPDDLTESRGKEQQSPRDNVLLELGLFIGKLGRDRVFMVVNRTADAKLPTDLAGITPAMFTPPQSGNWQSALGPASTAIENAIKDRGARRVESHDLGIRVSWFTDMQGMGFVVRVKNCDSKPLVPYYLCLNNPRGDTYKIFRDSHSGELLPSQEREHKVHIFRQGGEKLDFGIEKIFFEQDGKPKLTSEGFVFRVRMESSPAVLFESNELGEALLSLLYHFASNQTGEIIPAELQSVFANFGKPQEKWN